MRKGIDNFDELTTDIQARRIQVRKFIAQSCELAKRLPSRKKMLFLMRFDTGWSNREIADLCNCSETTVERRLKEITKEINEMRNCVKEESQGKKNDGKTNEKTEKSNGTII